MTTIALGTNEAPQTVAGKKSLWMRKYCFEVWLSPDNYSISQRYVTNNMAKTQADK